MTTSLRPLATEKPATSPRHLRHIRELDGVRGIAALMVFFHHLCFTSISPEGWGEPVRFVRNLCSVGDSGVDLFFVLSGFLITSLLIEARTTPRYYKDFYWKRALRILPLYALCLLGVLLFMPGSRNYVILCVIFISNFAGPLHIETIGPFWTLAIEEQFYLVWPTVVRRRSVAQLQRWAIGVGMAAVGLRFVAAVFGHFNYRLTFLRCDGLAFGAFLACWFYQRTPSKANSVKENRAIALTFILGVVLVLLSLPHAKQLQTEAFLAAIDSTGITLVLGSTIAFLVSHAGQRKLSWLRSPLLTFFGLISYAMYMIHTYVMLMYDHIRGELPTGNYFAYMVRLLTVFFVTTILCLISRYLVELPATSLRKYVLVRPRT